MSSIVNRLRRASIRALAVFVGVSVVVGTYVYTDTIKAALHDAFGATAGGADVVVSSRQTSSPMTAPASIPSSLVGRIQALPGVAAAQGRISDTATVIGRNGRIVKSIGSETVALSYLTPPFSGMQFVTGSPPAGMNQVALDSDTAAREHFHVGNLVRLVAAGPVRSFRVSGIVRLGSASLGRASVVVFDLATAQQLYGRTGRVDVAYVATLPGISTASVIRQIRPLLGRELVARPTGGQLNTDVQRVSDRLQLLTAGLTAFGLIAVVVGGLVIFNTLAVTAAQRSREFALLRALGATRSQLLGSVLGEALALGALASAAGVGGGLQAAELIRGLLGVTGLDLPSTSLVLRARTVGIGLAVGILVTLAAALVPVVRASRTAPLEALRESGAASPAPGFRRLLLAVATCLLIGGGLLILTSSGSSTGRLERSAAGALAIVLGLICLGPLVMSPLTRLVSWPIRRGDRVIPEIARENALRSPGRTAVSATALTVGIALVLFTTTYASGLRASTTRIIDRSFLGDFTIASQDGVIPIPAPVVRAVAVVPNLLAVSSLKTAPAALGRVGNVDAQGIEPDTIGQVYRFDWSKGSGTALSNLGPDDVLVERNTAERAHLGVGDHVRMRTETGTELPVTVRGIYSDSAVLTGFALPRATFDGLFHQSRLEDVFVKLTPGANRADAEAALRQALGNYPGVVVRSNRQVAHQVADRVNNVLTLFTALLVMSILISLIAIAGTLNLAVCERTRELGMLRAVGMTRRQARLLIRNESLITATIGSLIGIAVGIVLAWILSRAQSGDRVTFATPWAEALGLLAAGLLAGVIAAIPPARRAARLDLLDAIAHE